MELRVSQQHLFKEKTISLIHSNLRLHSVKTEKLTPEIDAKTAGNHDGPKKRRGGDDKRNPGKRRKLPKGACKNCPESTSHYTSE